MRVNPDHVAEIIQAAGPRAAPAAVANAAHRRVNLVKDGRRIQIHAPEFLLPPSSSQCFRDPVPYGLEHES